MFFPRLFSSPCGGFHRTAWNFSYCCKVLIFPPVCLSLSSGDGVCARAAGAAGATLPSRESRVTLDGRRGRQEVEGAGVAGSRRAHKQNEATQRGGSQQEMLSLGGGGDGGHSAWQREPAAGKHVCDKCDILKQRAAATQTWPYGGGHTNTAWVWGADGRRV